ncbi:hypothetical protein NPIL_62901 [Nephila pilipes]|uniref:Uncharacterized protein n=1 Tax=Nephila pilipes TaxID=299642 RepID=A0A8X6MM70_NEPPI|nr:hypothetical protein NPIL_62901 [Nephila pilipes]
MVSIKSFYLPHTGSISAHPTSNVTRRAGEQGISQGRKQEITTVQLLKLAPVPFALLAPTLMAERHYSPFCNTNTSSASHSLICISVLGRTSVSEPAFVHYHSGHVPWTGAFAINLRRKSTPNPPSS